MTISRFARVLDGLTRRVYQVDFSRCKDSAKFQEVLPFMMRNLEALAASLGREWPNGRIRRAAENLRLRAVRLLKACRALPESFAEGSEWRFVEGHIIANYEILRFEAGHLYQLVVPQSPFAVLRSAL
jgi:hypothetical protein